MGKIFLREVNTRGEISKEALIRYRVFVVGQKVPEEIEIDAHEDSCTHFLAFFGKIPVGCIRVRPVGRKLKLERLAVLPEFRGRGFGREIVRLAVGYCRRKKPSGIYMNAQYYLLEFYKKLGFEPRGKTFFEAGIKHVKMVLKAD
ncbi:MAG: GNAT family N-acetyltransferase [archaeon]